MTDDVRCLISDVEIALLHESAIPAAITELAALLLDAVEIGASVGFVLPFWIEDSIAWWTGISREFSSNERRILVARANGRIVESVQLCLCMMPNARHRAEVAKLLVDTRARRCGIGRRLMLSPEDVARNEGRSLLVLDTQTGSTAERLYRSMGYAAAGTIPNYAALPSGVLESTTFFSKVL